MPWPLMKYVSVEDYLQMEEAAELKHEYVDGCIVEKDGETIEHNDIVSNLIGEVGTFLKNKDYRIYPSAFRLTTPASKSFFYPDVTIVYGKPLLQPNIFDTLINPIIIFEIMSEGTENIDRGYKFFHYQHIPSLQEYVLIDSREYVIDIVCRQANGAWKFEKYFSTDKQIHLASINCTLSFDDIYYRVHWPSNTQP